MAKTHTWFATNDDMPLIVTWLKEAGAVLINGAGLEYDGVPDGREFPLHFPAIGPVHFWPNKINLPHSGDNSPRAKREILAYCHQKQTPDRPQIDVDRSAVAGIKFPKFRDGRYWVGGQIWFPTSRLHETFPELNRVCQKLERLFGKQRTVYDNRKGEDKSGFASHLCMSGVLQKVVALPDAFKLIQTGGFMVDPLTSERMYKGFRYRLRLSGDEPSE